MARTGCQTTYDRLSSPFELHYPLKGPPNVAGGPPVALLTLDKSHSKAKPKSTQIARPGQLPRLPLRSRAQRCERRTEGDLGCRSTVYYSSFVMQVASGQHTTRGHIHHTTIHHTPSTVHCRLLPRSGRLCVCMCVCVCVRGRTNHIPRSSPGITNE